MTCDSVYIMNEIFVWTQVVNKLLLLLCQEHFSSTSQFLLQVLNSRICRVMNYKPIDSYRIHVDEYLNHLLSWVWCIVYRPKLFPLVWLWLYYYFYLVGPCYIFARIICTTPPTPGPWCNWMILMTSIGISSYQNEKKNPVYFTIHLIICWPSTTSYKSLLYLGIKI